MIKFIWVWLAWFLKHRTLIHINYKSGIQEKFWVYFFHKRLNSDGKLLGLNWIAINQTDNPFIINIDAIESIWVKDVKGIFPIPESLKPKP